MLYKTLEGKKMVMALYDAALERWPVPYETRTISTRHGETFVIASGDTLAPVMILLHGAGGNSTMWASDIVDYIACYRVYALDMPGEAGKSSPNLLAWDGPAYSEWLEDVLDELDIDSATFVSLSQGGWATLKFAVRSPHRVDKLVLIAPGGIVPDRASFLPRAIGLTLLGTWGVKKMVQALFGDERVPQAVVDIVVQMTTQFKPRIGVVPVFSDDELRRLTMPIMLLGGTKDIIRDLDKIAARLRGLMPDLQVSIIPGLGHAMLSTHQYTMGFLAREAVRM